MNLVGHFRCGDRGAHRIVVAVILAALACRQLYSSHRAPDLKEIKAYLNSLPQVTARVFDQTEAWSLRPCRQRAWIIPKPCPSSESFYFCRFHPA